jgi:DNA-binding LytR/AlgR family response regulator
MLRAVVVEDQVIEREYLRQLLDEAGDVAVIAEAGSGPEALDLVTRFHPDLVFLDIGLPGLDGLEVARQLLLADLRPFIVFVTVDRQHAPEAFDLGSVDYLLKPYNRLRLAKTLARVRERMAPQRQAGRLVLSHKEEFQIIRLEEIVFIESDKRKRTVVHTETATFAARQSLAVIEDQLVRYPNFLRTSRSYLVNLDWVAKVEAWTNYSLRIVFRNCAKEAFLSRNNLVEFKRRLEALPFVPGQ